MSVQADKTGKPGPYLPNGDTWMVADIYFSVHVFSSILRRFAEILCINRKKKIKQISHIFIILLMELRMWKTLQLDLVFRARHRP